MARPNKRVPFPYIHGLNQHDQFELEEDFAYILDQIVPSPSEFDAIIDPSITASDASQHLYINLTELVASETWDVHSLFIVGVRQRGNVQIVEPASPLNIAALGDLALFGIGDFATDVNHLAWSWATLSCSVGQQVFLDNLSIDASTNPA